MNRSELVAAVAEETKLPRAKAAQAVSTIIKLIHQQLKEGGEARVAGLGVFAVGIRKAGKGRDPRSGAEIDIPEAKVVRFRAGKGLREAIS